MKNNLSLAFTVSESSVKTVCMLSILGCGTEVICIEVSMYMVHVFKHVMDSVCRSYPVCGVG